MAKILIVTDEMEVGGSQTQIVTFLSRWQPKGHELTVLFFRTRSHLIDDLEAAGIRVVQIEKRRRIDLGFFFELLSFFRRERFDLVHAFAFTGEFWTALALRLSPGTLFLSSVRGLHTEWGRIHWRIKGWISRQSVCVVSNSKIAADHTRTMARIGNTRLEVIYNGIRPLTEKPDQALQQRLQDLKARHDWMIATIGRVAEEKSLDHMLHAALGLSTEGLSICWIVVGSGRELEPLEKLSRELGLSNVFFLGEQSDVQSVYRAADVVVSTSRGEGISNSLLESLHAGTPVVASAVGGTVELVRPGQTGFLYEYGDTKALAGHLSELLHDPGLLRRLGQQAREDVSSRFAVATMVEQTAALYETLLNQKQQSAA